MPHHHLDMSRSRSDTPHHQGDAWVSALLLRLMDHSDVTIASLGRIETRLQHGDDRMDNHEARIEAMETARDKSAGDQPSRLERLIMRWGAILLPLAAILGTGTDRDLIEVAKAALLAGLK